MFNNIVLAGGTSMMKGFSNKIQKYLPSLLDNTDPGSINIIDDNQRHLSTWIGASMISSMSTFNRLLINKETLMETGEDRIGVGIFKKIF
jgi:actin-related protein